MVSKGYKKTFFNKRNLYLLVNFRIEGYDMRSLASLFHCDRGAVRKQCKLYSITPMERYQSFRGRRMIPFALPETQGARSQWYIEEGKRLNAGHSYKDYLANVPLQNKSR